MDYEKEYLPAEPEDDKVFVLKDSKAVEIDVPDDTGSPTDEEDEAPHVDYD